MSRKTSCLFSALASLLVAREAAAGPAALKLKVDPSVLAPGRTASVRVGFADPGGQACANDTLRRITLSLSSGAGQLDREFVDVDAGRGVSDAVTFTARASGDVILTARSQGLAPAQAVVAIRASASNGPLGRLVPAVYADSGIGFTVLSQPPNADDGQSGSWEGGQPAVLYANLLDPRDLARHPTLEVWTETGGWSITIGGGPAGGGRQRAGLVELATPISVKGPAAAREVCVLARIAENGEQAAPQRQCLRFAGSVPSRIAFDPQLASALASDTELALTLRVLDQFDRYIDPLTRTHEIEIISSHAGARLESGTPCPAPAGAAPGPCVTLVPGSARGRATLKWSGLSAGTTLRLTARDRDDTGHLADGRFEVVIAARPLALALLAAGAGILGGLARLFYRGVSLEGRQWYRLDLRAPRTSASAPSSG